MLPVAIGAIVIAAAAYGLTQVLGSSQPSGQNTSAAISPLPAPQVTANPRPIMWLGMEIVTTSRVPGDRDRAAQQQR